METCVRCIVAGRVQGVSFRAYTRREALRLGVAGWAKNLPDGRVEVVACGEAGAVEALCAWLWSGPPTARVTHVDCLPAEGGFPEGFQIR